MRRLHDEVILLLAALVLFLSLLLRLHLGNPLVPFLESYMWGGSYELLLNSVAAELLILLSIAAGLATVLLLLPLLGPWTIIFVANPLFASIFSSPNPVALLAPLIVAIFLASRSDRIVLYTLLLAPVYLLAPVTVPFAALVPLVTPATARMRRVARLCTAGLVGLIILVPLHDFAYNPLPFVEFGNLLAPSLLFTILALLEAGLLVVERQKRGIILLFVGLLALGLLSTEALLLAGLTSALLVTSFLQRLWNRSWVLPGARYYTLLVFGCLLLFLVLNHIMGVGMAEPTRSIAVTVASISEGTIMVPPAYAAYIAGQTPLDTWSAPEDLWDQLRFDAVAPELERAGVTYILFTEVYIESSLHFLVEHSDRFQPVIIGDVEIWRFTGADRR